MARDQVVNSNVTCSEVDQLKIAFWTCVLCHTVDVKSVPLLERQRQARKSKVAVDGEFRYVDKRNMHKLSNRMDK